MNGAPGRRALIWLVDEIHAPPFSEKAMDTAFYWIDAIRRYDPVSPKRIRSMPSVAPRCVELKIRDGEARKNWRILCRVDPTEVLVAAVFEKTSRKTPRHVIEAARARLKRYDEGRENGRQDDRDAEG